MTPYDPQKIAREAAVRITSEFINDPGRTAQEFREQAEALILAAAARMVKESGAVEELARWDVRSAALAKLKLLEGKP